MTKKKRKKLSFQKLLDPSVEKAEPEQSKYNKRIYQKMMTKNSISENTTTIPS